MITPIYSPAPGRYENGMKYRRCGKSGILLPEISLGLWHLSLIHISEPTRQAEISYAVFCLKKKKKKTKQKEKNKKKKKI